MSGFELLIDEIDGRLHAAVVRKGMLENLYVDARDQACAWASIYLGKVIKVDKRLDAAIVDLGGGVTGFLPAKHIHLQGSDPSESRTGITDLLKGGQLLLVQVKAEAKKESAHEHRKLPRLTTKLYIFGHSLLYSPVLNEVTISRHISSPELLKTTAALKGKGGWIVQKNAEELTEDDIHFESRSLLNLWQNIQSARENGGDAPRLLHRGPDALVRALNDYGALCFDHIHAGSKQILDSVIAWSQMFYPALAGSKRLRLFKPEKTGQKLFDLHDVFSELEALSDPYVALNDGGSLIIQPTQALVVIDVNQGSGSGIPAVNAAAAQEMARQLRLRNLSGVILIDFINMSERSARARLSDTLMAACGRDYGNTEIHGFTRLGIMEITRKRRTAFLSEKLKS
jgi:ribonuclease E/ribonuclease G